MAQIREAVKILEKALPTLPTGSDPYKSVLSAIQSISKHVSPGDEVPGVQQSALRGLQQDAARSAPLQSLMRSLSGGSAGAGMPGAGAGSPMPGAAPGAAPM